MGSPNVVPIKVVSHHGSAGHVSDRDDAAESDQGKSVAQWGEEQLARVRDIVEKCIRNMVEPLNVYALVLGIDMDDAAKPSILSSYMAHCAQQRKRTRNSPQVAHVEVQPRGSQEEMQAYGPSLHRPLR
jgi:hypothetical protein